MKTVLTSQRRIRVLTAGLAATVSLYALVIAIAEPLRTLAVSSPSSSVISLIVASTISNSCTASVSMGTITGNGDSDSGGFNASHASTCTVITNNSTGYSLAWNITTGTGAAGARSGTGHLNGYRSTANRIAPLTPAVASTPEVFSTATVSTSQSRWAARLSSTSTTPNGGPSWGTDGAADKWLNVATGSTVEIANRTTQTAIAGDTELIGFRAIIGTSKIQATDTYKATVVFTATTNP